MFRLQDLVSGIKTVYVLSAVDPSLLSTAKATMLLPFLKSATTVSAASVAWICSSSADSVWARSRTSASSVTTSSRCSAVPCWPCPAHRASSVAICKLRSSPCSTSRRTASRYVP